ncbi:sensor domain-containing diguanylate cyclase [bacterium]|jgi:GGDEF domain-containing protein|nr:sensor domain-containing diguanylate cyclase [bacterium]
MPENAGKKRKKINTAPSSVVFSKESIHLISQDRDTDSLFTHALLLLGRSLGKIEATIFAWDKHENILRCQKVLFMGVIQEGAELIALTKEMPLWQLVTGTTDIVIDRGRHKSACFALRFKNEFLGMVRVSLLTGTSLTQNIISQIHTFCMELAISLKNLTLFLQNEIHMRQLKGSFEITSNIVKSIYLNKLLGLVVKSIVKNLGFDRVRLYLVNKDEKLLKGEISYDMRGETTSLEKECYSLEHGIHPFVDMVLQFPDRETAVEFHDRVVYVPLHVKDQVVGILVVDNILSQEKISSDEIQTIKSFAGQIAMAVENARLFEKVQELSITDGLTRLFIIRHFKARLETELYRCKRYGDVLTLFILDVDNFKSVNDTYGHPNGDAVLQSIAKNIKENLRKTDFACRYGGDEFMVCLPNLKSQDTIEFGKRVLNSILLTAPIVNGARIPVTLSIGASCFPENSEDIEEIIKQADRALYKAKNQGKNQICIWTPDLR